MFPFFSSRGTATAKFEALEVSFLNRASAEEPNDRAAPTGTHDADEASPPGTIGAILIEAGRLSEFDARRIVAAQKLSGTAFGEQGVQMGLISSKDVEFALSNQFALPCLPQEHDGVDREVVAAYEPSHETVERLRNLRGQIALRSLEIDQPLRSIAILSADRQAGRSYIAANLATVFAQLGARTLLIDADYVNPRQHSLFRRNNRTGLSLVLVGRASPTVAQQVHGLSNLFLLPAGPTPPNPPDLLARPALAKLLRDCESHFDVILIDTPAWNTGSAPRHVAMAAGAALQVVHVGRTAADDARVLSHETTARGCRMLGVVMNDR